MQLRLKVIGGKNDGREIEIKGAEFVIGRGEDVDLRPKSDLISRRHCTLRVIDGKAILKDLNSANGTFLNNKRLEGEVQLKVGDRLRVGRLQFEVLIDHAKPSAKRPKVSGVKDAAVRASAGPSEATIDMEESITDWLAEADSDTDMANDLTHTKQFKLDENDREYTLPSTPSPTIADETVDKAIEDSVDDTDKKKGKGLPKPGKPKRGKLPERPKDTTGNSKDAATQALHKFFNRR